MSEELSTLEKEVKKKKDHKSAIKGNGGAKPALTFSKEARKAAAVSFEQNDEQGLSVFIDTENLHLRSATRKDEDSYIKLYGDKSVMEKFAMGVPLDRETVETRITTWEDRWKKNIPFSSFAVFKQDSDEFTGHIVLGFGEKPRESELAYLFHRKYWNQRIGTESVSAVVLDYAPELPKRGYKINEQPFEAIVATAREDNPASWKILEKVGMECEGQQDKFGKKRKLYRKKVS